MAVWNGKHVAIFEPFGATLRNAGGPLFLFTERVPGHSIVSPVTEKVVVWGVLVSVFVPFTCAPTQCVWSHIILKPVKITEMQ